MSAKRPFRILCCQFLFWVKVMIALSLGICGLGYEILLVIQYRHAALNPYVPPVSNNSANPAPIGIVNPPPIGGAKNVNLGPRYLIVDEDEAAFPAAVAAAAVDGEEVKAEAVVEAVEDITSSSNGELVRRRRNYQVMYS
ncbi:hypothetical protein HDU97_005624 [Phlyctochytrium planicorne]|nr:hypothetical protein HDU97_005624 [Phlyctochytrium planicorne]